MDKLKQYIRQHQPEFDAYELPEGFDVRFEQRLTRARSRSLRHFMAVVVAVAACGLLLVWLPLHFLPRSAIHAEVSNELTFNDVSSYYSQEIDQLMQQICSATAQRSPGDECMLCVEAQRLYDEKVLFEHGEMQLLTPDKQSLAVLYTFYSTKLENLELLLNLARQQ